MKRLFLSLSLIVHFTCSAYSQELPEKPIKNTLVHDFSSMFNESEKIGLKKLQTKFIKKKNVEIVIVTVKSMNGLEALDYAYKLANHWDLDYNMRQLIVVLKPKYTNEKGEIAIASSFGNMDSVISDSSLKKIIDETIIPKFKNKKIFKGMKAGLKKIYNKI